MFLCIFLIHKNTKRSAVKTQGTVFIFQVCAMAIAFNCFLKGDDHDGNEHRTGKVHPDNKKHLIFRHTKRSKHEIVREKF